MNVNSVTPDLMVEDLAETVEWYERVFDAEVVASLPAAADEEHYWVQIVIEGTPLMLQERGSLEEKLPVMEGADIGGSVALYFDVADTRTLYESLQDAGVEIVSEPTETDFGWRQFAAVDCNGYVLWFGEQLDPEESENIGREHRVLKDHLVDQAPGQPRKAAHSAPGKERKHWG